MRLLLLLLQLLSVAASATASTYAHTVLDVVSSRWCYGL
jgi:hypothetical protein